MFRAPVRGQHPGWPQVQPDTYPRLSESIAPGLGCIPGSNPIACGCGGPGCTLWLLGPRRRQRGIVRCDEHRQQARGLRLARILADEVAASRRLEEALARLV